MFPIELSRQLLEPPRTGVLLKLEEGKEISTMSKILSILLILGLWTAVPALAADGVVLINQAKVIQQGGFPFKITRSGSYKLSGNLVVPPNVNGIEFRAEDITLDLNGFTIAGPVVCGFQGQNCAPFPTTTTWGIRAFALSVSVRNGHIRGFTNGIQAFGGLLEELNVFSNSSTGLIANDAVVRRNNARSNGGFGIACFDCVVTENIARENASSGFTVGGNGVFGSNQLFSSPGQFLGITSTVTSQRNNNCDGFTC